MGVLPGDAARLMERWLAIVISLSALAAALAALLLPAEALGIPDVAAVLAVGAVAVLAGHGWGLAIVVLGDVVLLGAAWPLAFQQTPPSDVAVIATYLAVAGALPGLFLFARTIGPTVQLVTGRSRHDLWHRAAATATMVVGAAWLLRPVF